MSEQNPKKGPALPVVEFVDKAQNQTASASPVSDAVERETFLQQLRRLSVERAKNGFKTYDNQPITYWTTAIIGEFGELCNMIKKMKRAENGGHDSGHSYTAKDITPKMLREEIGGTLIYIDLLCSFLNIDIEEAVTETFNEKSVELGFPYLLNPPTPTNVQEQDESYKPYFGWCDVEGCENEGCRGGGVWAETGYWIVCSKHSADYREGKPKPEMKKSSMDREATRGANGVLPLNTITKKQ